MNFKRIEWIFVIAFIALDIFLLSVYVTQNDTIDQRTSSFSTTSTSGSVLKSIKMIRSLMVVYPINHKLVIMSPAQIQIFCGRRLTSCIIVGNMPTIN